MNAKLLRRKIKIDGSVSRDVYDGVVADVSTFVIDEAGEPVMSRNGFAMLVHVGKDPRAELFTHYANDVDSVVPLTGYDAAFDADRIVNQAEHLLKDIRKVAVNAARRNPHIPAPGQKFQVLSSYISVADMGQSNTYFYLTLVMNDDGSATLIMDGKPATHKGGVLPAAEVKRLFTHGKSAGLGNTSLSEPTILR
jgi:hypothetical protein